MARGKRDLNRYPRLSASRKRNLKLRMKKLGAKRWNKACDEMEQTAENVVLPVEQNSSFRFAISKKDLAEAGCSSMSTAYNIADDDSAHNTTARKSSNDYATTENQDQFFPEGRRIVDVGHLFKTLLSHKHNALFSCSFTDMYVMKETRKGFISTFILKCAICKSILNICTDEPNTEVLDVNVAAVSAIVTTGGGYSQLSEIAAVMNIPTMSSALFTKSQNKFADVIEDSTWLSIKNAGQEEATLATDAGDVDDAGIPCITVIADGAWSKRSYRVNYNASSGVACIIGHRTGKILFIGVKNKYCCICDRTKITAAEPVQHKCYKNWEGPSTGMESAIIVDGFSRSIEMHGVKYTKLVGDGDSSVHRKLLQTRPYGPDVLIEKIECSNHLLRNYSAKLKDLSQKRYSSSGRAVSQTMRNVLGTNIRRLRTAVEYAAKYRRMDKTWTSACEHLKQDIINSPHHVFGDHTHCSAYFCTGKKSRETNWIPEMKLCGLYQDIMSTLNRLALNTKSLYLNMTNNAAETYNSVVAKFSGGKRINFSRRGSYQLRCNAAALSYNSRGQLHSIIHKKITTCSPGHYTKRFVHNMTARYNKRKGAGPRIRKKLTFASADTEYGPEAAQTVEDMTATEYARKKNQFLARLKKSEEDIIAIERNTVGQSANHSWHEERMNRITASNFGRICKLRQSTNCSATVKSLLYSTFTGNASTRYGITHETVAMKTFEESYNLKVESCGIFIDNNFFFLAASPDGLVGEDSIIEIKCPAKSTKLSPVESILQKKTDFSTYNSDKFEVKRNHNYYYQVQGQLHITKRQYCYFIFWTPVGMLVEKIEKDDNFWMERMQNQLKTFYFDCLLPEIIDPRYPRKLPIRNPEYREKK